MRFIPWHIYQGITVGKKEDFRISKLISNIFLIKGGKIYTLALNI